MKDLASNIKTRLLAMPRLPLAFLGFGLHRAWFELVFTLPPALVNQPYVIRQDFLDLIMVATLFICAGFARRKASLKEHPSVWVGATMLLVMVTAFAYMGVFIPQLLPFVRIAGSLLGGVGIGFMMALWLERYGSLAPGQILFYYAGAILAGAVVIWVYRGYVAAWQTVMIGFLPLLSLLLLRQSYRLTLVNEPATPEPGIRFTFPWKPMLMVALYSFAFSLQNVAQAVPGLYSSAGTIVAAVVILAAFTLFANHIEFETIYSMVLPFFSAVFLLLPASGALPAWWESFFNCWGYAANEMFVVTMIGAIAYRYGVNALWLYGIEFGVRYLVLMGGRILRDHLLAQGFGTSLLVIIAIALATLIIVSEMKLDSRWGIELHKSQDVDHTQSSTALKNDLGTRCAELARIHGLTQREGEVLLLLAQHKTTAQIEEELVIANGTAKAHISHVYQKIGVHNREELFELIEK